MKNYPTREALIRAFEYHAATGTFTRRRDGADPTTLLNGYPVIYAAGHQHPRAALVWIMETGNPPPGKLYRRTGGPLDTAFGNLSLTSVRSRKPQPWVNERDNPAVARHRAWCKARDLKPIGDVMIARLLDPGT